MTLYEPLERMISRRLRDHLAGKPPNRSDLTSVPTAPPQTPWTCASTKRCSALARYKNRSGACGPYARAFGCADHGTAAGQSVGPYRTRWVMDFLHAEARKGQA